MPCLPPVFRVLFLLLPICAPVQSSWAADKDTAPFGPVSGEKLGHYIKGYNFLIGTFGLPVEYRGYAAQQVAKKTVNDGVVINVGWIDLADDELKQGSAIQGGSIGDADAAAGRMIPILDRLVERLKGLNAYYSSRGQLVDNFARGKSEDPLVLADFKAGLEALGALDRSIDAAIECRDAADLEALKASGDLVGYDGGLALQKAKALVGLFDSPSSLAGTARDPAVIARADALVASMQAALADEDTQLASKAGNDTDHALRDSNYKMAAERLQDLVGTYRTLKQTGNPALYPMMVGAYNSAIDEVNIGQ